MTVGFSTTNTVNAWLNTLRGTSAATFTGVTTMFAQLHTGDPGASGTANVSSTTTRQAVNYAAASGGSQSITGTTQWTAWAGTNGEVVTHISLWGASSAGTFYYSVALTASKTVNTGDTLTLNTLSVSLSPLAA
jgi:hypothetical protein